jgi:hypothetical protein
MNDAPAPPPADPSTPPPAEPASPTADAQAATPTAPEAPSVDTPKLVKSPSLIRRSAVIFLLIFVALGFASFPFVIQPWVIGLVHKSLESQGLVLSDDSHLSVNFLDGSVSGNDLHIHEFEGAQNVFTAKQLHADLAIWQSITSGDMVLSKLIVDGLSGSLRRNDKGRIPIFEPPGTEPGKPIDWLTIGQQLIDWYKKYAPELSADTDPNAPPPEPVPPKAKPATDWPNAVIYEPQPQPGTQWPRLVVHDLLINGTQLGLPDDSPFDITEFTLKGTFVALRLRPHEVMTLEGHLSTKGSGPLTLLINRAGGASGTLQLNAKEVSIKALSNPAITGDALTTYGTTGTTDLLIDTQWKGWKQTSTVTSQLRDVTMQPTKDAGDTARQLASAINAFGGKPVAWSPTLGGTLYAPVFTDYGIKSLQASALDAGKAKVIDEGAKQLNQQLDKNPELKNATDKAKDLFKGVGK